MSWSIIRFAIAKGHFVSEALRTPVLEEGVERKFGFVSEKPLEEGGMDLPGMVFTDRGWEDIDLPGGLKFSFPYSDFAIFFHTLQELHPRKFKSGETYYKLHGWLTCLVLTPGERDFLLEYMKTNLARVADEYEKETARIMARLEKK